MRIASETDYMKCSKLINEEYQSYLVGISEWKTDYNFSIGIGSQSDNAYSEFFEIEISGHLIAPEEYTDKTIKLILLGNRVLDAELDNQSEIPHQPSSVGKLTLRGESAEYLGSLPASSLRGIMHFLDSEKVRYIVLHGSKPKYGSAQIISVTFKTEYDAENF